MAVSPTSWLWGRVKDVAVLNAATLAEDTDPDFSFPYVDISTVDGLGVVAKPDEVVFANAPSRARRLAKPGDSIVSTVRTYLKAIAYVDEELAGCVFSTGFTVLSPKPNIAPRFLYWWLRSSYFIEEIVARSVGVSYPAVNASDVSQVAVPIPPMAEQLRIAEYLDSEVALLDDLVAQQVALTGSQVSTAGAGLLGERRQALITAAVSGGLKSIRGRSDA